jgi:hypothetical protein
MEKKGSRVGMDKRDSRVEMHKSVPVGRMEDGRVPSPISGRTSSVRKGVKAQRGPAEIMTKRAAGDQLNREEVLM